MLCSETYYLSVILVSLRLEVSCSSFLVKERTRKSRVTLTNNLFKDWLKTNNQKTWI